MTLTQTIEQHLSLHHWPDALRDATFLAEDLTLLAHENGALVDDAQAIKAANALLEGQPLAYASGLAHFYGLTMRVSPAVLIPRPETEELVEWVFSENKHLTAPKVLDMCTGSGCIALAYKYLHPQATVMASDISEDALGIARLNARRLSMDVSFIPHDCLSPTPPALGLIPDIIISNPPYIPTSERNKMGESTLRYEPALALFTEGEDGMEFYEALARWGQHYANQSGNTTVYAEINEFRAAATVKVFEDNRGREILIRKDMAGADRMLKAIFKKV